MYNIYFTSAYRELMFVRGLVSEIICEQTAMFADLSLFLLRTFVNEKFSEQEFFSFSVTLYSVIMFGIKRHICIHLHKIKSSRQS